MSDLTKQEIEKLEVEAYEAAIKLENETSGKVKIDINSYTLGAIWILEKLANEANKQPDTKALPLHSVVFSDDECKHKATCGNALCSISKCDEYEKAEVCPTCRNSPFVSEFSKEVRTRKCVDCGK